MSGGGGSRTKMRKLRNVRQTKTSFASRVKRLVLKQAELKKFYKIDYSGMNANYGHATDGVESVLQNLLGVGVGNTNQKRIGQEVHGKNIEMNILYETKTAYPQQNIRCIVFREEAGTAAKPPGFFVGGSATAGHNVLADVDTDKYKVVYDKIFKIQGQNKDAGTENCHAIRFKVPLNKKITYRDANTPDGKNTYSLMVIPWVDTTVADGTDCGKVSIASKFNFQDL